MQIYAIRSYNFLRFGEKNNSLVFDLSQQQKEDIINGKTTLDVIYDEVLKNPLAHIKEVKARGVEKLLGITGLIDGNPKDSNGSGKSSVMESICYAHYEKIIRKTANTDKVEKAGLAVVTKINGKYPEGMKESYVEEVLEDNSKVYVVRRGREFSKNQKTSVPLINFYCVNDDSVDSMVGHRSADTKQAVEDVITMDYDVFVNSQMFGQNDSGKYLMGTDKTKKEMLISLLRLENVVAGCLELLRTRKNAQHRKVDALKLNVQSFEEMFREAYAQRCLDRPQNFESTMIDKVISQIGISIFEAQANSRKLAKEVGELDSQVAELGKSDKLVKVENIKTEGRKLQTDKKAKEQEMLSRSAEWDKLEKEAGQSLETKNKQFADLLSSVAQQKAQRTALEDEIKAFNGVDHAKQLDLVAKAKIALPINYEKEVLLRREKEALLEKTGKLLSDIERHSDEITSFNRQLKNVDASGKFVCAECKSIVTMAHVVGKIEERTADKKKAQQEHLELSDKVAIKSTELGEIKKKLTRINDFLILEPKLLASLEKYETNKKRVIEISENMEKNGKWVLALEDEIKILKSKRTEYGNKSKEVKAAYEKDLAELNVKIQALVQQLKQAENDALSVKMQIVTLKAKQKALSDEKNSLLEKIGSLGKDKENYEKAKLDFSDKQSVLDKEAKYLQRMEFLEGVFGLDGIQTRIIKKYLPLLNVYTKEFLDILSDGNISVKMIINDKSKVDMAIVGGTADTYEMLSGGEKKIIKLAVAIGMSLLAFSRSAQKPEIICLDEIFADLDENKTHNVFLMLKKLSEKFSRVIVISHKPDINSRIEHHIVVEKDAGKFGLSRIVKIT